MSTPPPRPEPLHHIKSAARKLPIKRRPNPYEPPNSSIPTPTPIPNPLPFSIIVDDGDGDAHAHAPSSPSLSPRSHSPSSPRSHSPSSAPQPVPFKFQRIWSESDEVRFLKGLLSCHSQGMVFPRDLNAFFDRFSQSMPQPYTRSQLSEKLRRLRKKFRIASSRVLRGMDPSALSPHDREVFHLSSHLWDPSFSHSSPFGSSGPEASKRRRRLPPPPHHNEHVVPVVPRGPPPPPVSPSGNGHVDNRDCRGEEKPPEGDGGSVKIAVMKALLDVLQSSLEEVKNVAAARGGGGDLARRWEEQRVMELDVLAGRLRLGIEDASSRG